MRSEKVIAETGLLLLAASTVSDEDVAALVRELARELVPHARSDRILMGLALEPAAAWDYAQAHVFLTRLALPDAGFDRVLTASETAQSARGRERVPYRVLERSWLRSGLLSTSPTTDHATLVGDGVLEHPVDLLMGSREDLYAFSHALMYVGDFGLHPAPWPRPPSDICAEAEGALGWCLDQQDYDLSAELLLAWPQSGTHWSATSAFGFRVLATVEDKAGFLPSHTVRLDRLRELEGDDHTDYLLASTYHTIYAMGLLCSMALQSAKAPPASIPVGGTIPGAAEQIEPFLPSVDRTPHWATEYQHLNRAERDALAPLLLSIAVRRCVDARQFSSVHQLLSIAQKMGLADTPFASQAAELLGRLETLSEVLEDSEVRR